MAEQKSPAGGQTVLAIALGLGLAAALYGGAWLVSAHLLRNGVEHWLEALRGDGFTVHTGPLATTGFPARVAVRVPEIDFAAPPARGRWTWRAPVVEVTVSTLRIDHVVLDLSGAHRLAGPWRESPSLQFTAAKAALSLDLKDGAIDEAQLTVEDGDGAWGADSRMHVDKAGVRIALNPDAPPPAPPASGKAGDTLPKVSSRLTVRIENLTVPGALPPPLSNTLREIAFNADMVGPFGDGPLPKLLAAWSAAGGAVDLKDVTLDWPPMTISGEGSVALDQELQPIGAFTSRVAGFTDVLDIMVREHRMADGEATVAKAMLGLMAKPGPGGRAEIGVPLTVQERVLSAGPLKLFEVPRLDWPQAPPS
jgi:hypothetical protein